MDDIAPMVDDIPLAQVSPLFDIDRGDNVRRIVVVAPPLVVIFP